MNILIENKKILSELAQVASMNYGQMQRWQDFESLNYTLELAEELFIEKITHYFAQFREAEMKENDPFDFPELVAFKRIGWPDLNKLASEHRAILSDLIRYNQHEILQLIIEHPVNKHNYYYAINSVDKVLFEDNMIKLKGICFQSDYVEHSYNHELPRKYALLKKNE
jgi:hypothetical protein